MWPLRPSMARRAEFQRDARRAAGMTEDFIDLLEGASQEDEQDLH
jgi:hypothetical protein